MGEIAQSIRERNPFTHHAAEPLFTDSLTATLNTSALTAGLAMCNQHTMVLFLLPIIGWVLIVLAVRRELTFARFLGLAVVFFVGLVPYAHLAWASTYNLQRGSWGDLSTLDGFIRHIRRADYGTFRLYVTEKKTAGMVERLHMYAKDFYAEQAFYIGPIFVVIGVLVSFIYITLLNIGDENTPQVKAVKNVDDSSELRGDPEEDGEGKGGDRGKPKTSTGGFRAHRSAPFMILAAYLFYMLVFHYLANLPVDEALLFGVQARFWQQPNVIAFFWVGIGLSWVTIRTLRQIIENLYELHHPLTQLLSRRHRTKFYSASLIIPTASSAGLASHHGNLGSNLPDYKEL